MESFFKTLKYEEVHLSNYETYDDVIRTASPFHRGGVQQETIAFGSGVLTPGGIRDGDSDNLKPPVALPSNLGENSPVGGAQSTGPAFPDFGR